MKKLVFVAVVLVAIIGISSTTQAFWGFGKKVEVKNKQAENNMGATILAIKGESELAKLVINKEGTAFSLLAGGAKVLSNTAGTLTAEVSFGSSKVNLTVNTNADTKVYKAYDGRSELFNVANIAVNDNLSLQGDLDATATTLTITAKKIKDFSVQSRNANFSGTITATTTNSFVLDIPSNERDLTVDIVASTIIKKLEKNTNTESSILPSDLKVGDIVQSVTGVVNTQTMKMTAKKIVVSERDIQTIKIKNVFATVLSVDKGNSMRVKTTAGSEYIVNFKITNTVYNKWTISKKYSGVWDRSKTNGVIEKVLSVGNLGLVEDNKVWISGDLDTKTSTVIPSLIEKEFYK